MAKRRMYAFAEEKHSGKGVLSTVLGALSLIIFVTLAWLAWYMDGEGGIYLGSIGFMGMMFTLCGVVLGLMSFSENNVRYFFSKTGSILNGIMTALWVFVILIGI